jgi:hypothetical protein
MGTFVYQSRVAVWSAVVAAVVATVIAVVSLVHQSLVFAGWALFAVGLFSYRARGYAWRVELTLDGALTIRLLGGRSERTNLRAIRSIKLTSGEGKHWVVRHEGGHFLLGHSSRARDLIDLMISHRPSIECNRSL